MSKLSLISFFLMLSFNAISQNIDFAGEDKLICMGGMTKIGSTAPCESCCFKWSPSKGLDNINKPDPVVSGLEESTIYTVTVTYPDGNFVVDYMTVFVYSSNIDIFSPRFILANNSPDQMIPVNQKKIPGAQTMVNIDNDDNDEFFDNDDDEISGGDDEFVKIRLQLMIHLPQFAPPLVDAKSPPPPPLEYRGMFELAQNSNLDGVRLWRSKEKLDGEYLLGEPITLTPIGGDTYEGYIWAEGIEGQTTSQQTKLRGKAFGDHSGCSDDDYVSLTIVSINSIEWEGQGNGYTGDGKNNSNVLDVLVEKNGSNVNRVFPEGKYENGSVSSERITVNVKVTFSTAPVSNFVLFMRAFDIDDPSTDLTFVDPNDSGTSGTYEGGVGLMYTKDEDNRGLVSFLVNPSLPTKQKYGAFLDAIGSGINVSCDNQNLGIFRKTAIAGNAIFNVNFKVSKHPGDNYKIAMYGDKDFLINLRNEDQFDQDKIVDKTTGTGGTCKPIKSNFTSLPLTVFRTLHIECDKMRKANQIAPANENGEIINAYFTDFDLLYDDDPKITVVRNVIDVNGQSIHLNDGSISPRRFQGGAIKIGNLPLVPNAISKTEINSLVEVGYMNPDLGGKPSFAGLRCKSLSKF